MQSVNIRPVHQSDISELLSLCEMLGYSVSEPELIKRVQQVITSSHNQILVATINDEVIGFIQVFIKELIIQPKAAEIGGLVVDDNHQGQGVGKALMAAAEAWAIENKCERIVVKSNVIRTAAHEFYQKNGYQINKRQVVFEKIINK